jgi:hypothetical protein
MRATSGRLAHQEEPLMSSSEITGSIVERAGKRGTVLYAKVRVEGEQKWIRLGKLWQNKGRPAAGYVDQGSGRGSP